MFIDWEGKKPQDFEFKIIPEEIRENGTQVVFPVAVTLKDKGDPAADFSIPMRAEYYRQLRRKGPRGEKVILEVIQNRVYEELKKRIKAERVDIETKISLHEMGTIKIPAKEDKA